MRRTPRYLSPGVIALIAFLWTPVGLSPQEAPADTAKKKEKKKPLPLQSDRAVKISTDEGSWLSLDVSPDGRTVVFDLLGDLFTVPLEGGTASQITRGLAWDEQPRFSPDGKKVLFVSDRSGGENLWTLALETGDTTQITKGNGGQYMSPDWTPDGAYVVASKGETRLGVVNLWLGHVEGGSGQMLVRPPEGQGGPGGFQQQPKSVGAAVSPDGRYIWFGRRRGSWQYNAQFPQYQLAVYDRETGQTYSRSSRYGSAFRPTLSPDGRWLAYGTRHDEQTGLRLRDLRTGEERWLAYPVQRDDQESIADRDVYPGMSFTPDSRELVASYGGKIWRLPIAGGDAIPVPFRVEEELPIGPSLYTHYQIEDTPTFTIRQIRNAVPSPDGTRLTFTALDRLYVMEWPDGEPRRLTTAEVTEAEPAWSPDGEWIAYVTWDDRAGGHIWKVRADARGGGGRNAPVRLTVTPETYQQPAWSPGGDRIVAIRGSAEAYREGTGPRSPGAATDIVWVPADPSGSAGSPSTFIAPTEGRAYPHFTEDPDRIFFSHGGRGLVSLRWDGTDEKEHVKVAGNKRPGARQPNNASLTLMAPVGDRALAQVNDHVYVVTVPYVGGKTPTISVADPERSAFPARKLTEIGGQFPAWGADGHTVHWSIGNAHFVYDLERAKAVEDSIRAARKAAEEAEGAEGEETGEEAAGQAEEAGGERADEKEEKKEEEEEGYRPLERRIEIQAARDIPRGTVVLRGGRVITMRGDEVIEDADVVIHDNRIQAVARRGEAAVPEGAEVIDVAGKTITPGFVDTHSHMWPAWGLHKNQVWIYLANLAYGVTTTRDPQTSTTDVLTYGDRVTAGRILGPRIYSTGPGVFGDYVEDPIQDLDHARKILKQYSEYYDTKTIKMYMAGNRQQRQWIIMAAREQGLMPTTEGGLMLAYDLTLALDGYPGLEHSLPISPLYDDVVQLLAQSGTTYTPTLLVAYGGPWGENYWFEEHNPHDDVKLRRFTPHSDLDRRSRRRNAGWFRYDEHVFPDHAATLKRTIEGGGHAGVGSHGQLQGLGYHWELWSMGAGGLGNHDLLRTATIFGARAIGLDEELGSLEPGKLADLLVMDGNPLEEIRNTNTLHFVMKNGRLYEAETLDEVWPRQRKLEPGGWVQDEPDGVPGVPPR
ncbi:MAG: amidohydrolase family protein [Gemmatimonadota bacterium]